MYRITISLLRGGALLDFPAFGSRQTLESRAARITSPGEGRANEPWQGRASGEGLANDALELAKAVRAAQSTSTSTRLTPWQKYCLVPPKELLRLRSLVARGRAREKVRTRTKTPREISLLFARSFPNELFWKVLAFWNPRH